MKNYPADISVCTISSFLMIHKALTYSHGLSFKDVSNKRLQRWIVTTRATVMLDLLRALRAVSAYISHTTFCPIKPMYFPNMPC